MHSPETRREAPLFSTPEAESRAPNDSSERRSPSVVAIAVLALAAVVFGRALATALPGSTDGIGRFLRAVDVAAAIATQTFVLCALTLAVTLLVGTLWHKHLNYAYRLIALPTGSAVVLFVAISTQHRLQGVELALMGVGALALSGAASVVALREPETRATGLVLGAVTAASSCYLAARALSLDVVEIRRDLLVRAARLLATAGFALDLVSLGVTMAWMSSRRVRAFLAAFGAAAVLATLVTWGAMVGSHDGAAVWQVIASRALSTLTPHPAPLVTLAGRYWVECFALALSVIVLLSRGRASTLQLSVGLSLLARATVDVPVSALLLTLAALIAPLERSNGGTPGMWKT